VPTTMLALSHIRSLTSQPIEAKTMAGVCSKPLRSGKYQGWFIDHTGKQRYFVGTRSKTQTRRMAERLEDEHRPDALWVQATPQSEGPACLMLSARNRHCLYCLGQEPGWQRREGLASYPAPQTTAAARVVAGISRQSGPGRFRRRPSQSRSRPAHAPGPRANRQHADQRCGNAPRLLPLGCRAGVSAK
jgi:hypothetical protein